MQNATFTGQSIRFITDTTCPPNFTCSGTAAPVKNNGWAASVSHTVDSIMIWVLAVTLVLMIIYIIVGTFLSTSADGNVEGKDMARGRINGAMAGVGVVIIAYVLVKIVLYFLTTR